LKRVRGEFLLEGGLNERGGIVGEKIKTLGEEGKGGWKKQAEATISGSDPKGEKRRGERLEEEKRGRRNRKEKEGRMGPLRGAYWIAGKGTWVRAHRRIPGVTLFGNANVNDAPDLRTSCAASVHIPMVV